VIYADETPRQDGRPPEYVPRRLHRVPLNPALKHRRRSAADIATGGARRRLERLTTGGSFRSATATAGLPAILHERGCTALCAAPTTCVISRPVYTFDPGGAAMGPGPWPTCYPRQRRRGPPARAARPARLTEARWPPIKTGLVPYRGGRRPQREASNLLWFDKPGKTPHKTAKGRATAWAAAVPRQPRT